ncbi:hypothetical protein PTSG_11452 [Salpingoeca rosetta]|uniref:Rad26/CSB-like winged helix DNA-binding domain-containing protein n=1 Tax=Salpingoeca rosetta (strain ATCC 50818 / BSB-021) TaxID=946362 RepID=F2UTH4_SALR5|nr:uncharacterized protein PTSG_11452 [Salpingoeca rosetta]EGD83281.1 hypothetical protein PTSG_11452 [Salpingoeca rosetta]|eukprot:XP_004987531.1 hypothetical protein PTSG_11452 [Salpingoeca rosetta]
MQLQVSAAKRFGGGRKTFGAGGAGGGDGTSPSSSGDGDGRGRGDTTGSRGIMAQIKKRKQDVSAAHASEFAVPLLKEIRQFIKEKGGRASTQALLDHFNKRVAGSRQAVFVRLLHSTCTFSRVGSKGYWSIKPE